MNGIKLMVCLALTSVVGGAWGAPVVSLTKPFVDPIVRETVQAKQVAPLLQMDVAGVRVIEPFAVEVSGSITRGTLLLRSGESILAQAPIVKGVASFTQVMLPAGVSSVEVALGLSAKMMPGTLRVVKTTLGDLSQTVPEAVVVVARVAETPRADGFTTAPIAEMPKSQNVGKPNQRIYTNGTYRIPALTRLGGQLIAAFDLRYRGNNTGGGDLGAADKGCDGAMAMSRDGGLTWTKPYVGINVPNAFDGKGKTTPMSKEVDFSDPCLLTDPVTKTAFVVGMTGNGLHGINDCVIYQSKNGRTWSKRTSLQTSAGKRDNRILQGPGSGIAMRDGTLVLPMQTFNGTIRPYVATSQDHGKSWQHSANAGNRGASESAVCELENGDILLMAKCEYGYNGNGAHAFYRSADLGKSWHQLAEIRDNTADLPKGAPTCQGSLVRVQFAQGDQPSLVACAWPTRWSDKPGFNYRGRIQIRLGIDQSKTVGPKAEPIKWLPQRIQIREAAYGHGYSSMTMIDADTLGIFYEDEYGMMFTRISIQDALSR